MKYVTLHVPVPTLKSIHTRQFGQYLTHQVEQPEQLEITRKIRISPPTKNLKLPTHTNRHNPPQKYHAGP